MKALLIKVKEWLKSLSFKTGLWVLGASAVCYIVSFAQAALPISLAWKGALWVIFFGLAKTFQYGGLLIIGKEGIKKLKRRFRKNSSPATP